MLREIFAHHQEVLYVQQLVYFCAYYVGWQPVGSEWNSFTPTLLAHILCLTVVSG
jgi:hypothetical protein